MALSQVDICNTALARIGCGHISSMTENSEARVQCTLQWPITLLASLRAFPWAFATKMKKLELLSLSDEYIIPGWAYAYKVPVKCLNIRNLFNEATLGLTDPVPYKQSDVDGVGVVIYTNLEGAYCEYTYEVTDITRFDAAFANAFAWHLAANISVPLTGNKELRDSILSIADHDLTIAKDLSIKEGNDTKVIVSAYAAARG